MSSSNVNKIARNTLLLYFRQILIMIVSLYTVRVVLQVLGAEDYGINNVVAGFVAMFGFLSGTMASASQRYFSYDLGKGDKEHLHKTYCITFIIYILVCLFVLIIAETLGLWFVINKLVIPSTRRTQALWVYEFSIVSFIFTLITTPHKAVIIAHESMDAYAYISIIEVVLKLLIVFVVQVIDFDKLVAYSFFISVLTSLSSLLYVIYAHKRFEECRFKFLWDSSMFKEMLSYSGWNLFGSLAGMLRNQGLNIIMNLFFGPIVNAARGVASQVSAAVESFSQNFSTAMKPQIIMNYAQGELDKSIRLVYTGCKLSYFLMFLFSLPLCLEMDYVLTLWLKTPPKYTVIFTQLILINSLVDVVNFPIMTLAQATGKIKLYQSVVGGILLLILPVSYICLKLNLGPLSPFIVSIAITAISAFVRLLILKRLVKFSVLKFIYKTYIPCITVSILTFIGLYFIKHYLVSGFIRLIIVSFASTVLLTIFIWLLGLDKTEKSLVLNIINNKIRGRN